MTGVQSFLDTLGPEIEDAEEGKLEYPSPPVCQGHGCGGNRGICFVQLDFSTFHNLGWSVTLQLTVAEDICQLNKHDGPLLQQHHQMFVYQDFIWTSQALAER